MMKMMAPANRADSFEDRTPPTNIIAAYSADGMRIKRTKPLFVVCARGKKKRAEGGMRGSGS